MLSGKYLLIKKASLLFPILFFKKVKILKKISVIAMIYTNDEKLLKNHATIKISTIKIIKSIYILSTYFSLISISY